MIKPSSDIDTIKKTAINGIQTTGVRTDIDAGIQVAKANVSADTTLNKYFILLTDGVPNTAVGGPTSTYGGERLQLKLKATLSTF